MELKNVPEVVDYDKYDEWKFLENVDAREKDFFSVVDSKKYEEKNVTNASVGGDMLNIFSSLFRKSWRWKDENNDSELRTFIEELSKTEEFENMRVVTIKNDSAAFAASMKLIEKFDRELKEDIENSDGSQGDRAKIRSKIRAAASAAEKEAEDTDKAENALGGYGDEDPSNPGDDVRERVKKLTKKFGQKFFKLLVNMIGRMKSMSESVLHAYTDKGMISPVGIERGGDLERLVPSELMKKLISPKLFLAELMEKKLQQIRYEGEESMCGPIVALIDESSSMGGTLNMLSKALMFGLWNVARREGRKFYVIPFSTQLGQCREINTNADMDAVLMGFLGGGTDFDLPLMAGLSVINTVKDFDTADIIVVTDGESEISETTVEAFKQLEGKLRVIVAQLDEHGLDCTPDGNIVSNRRHYSGVVDKVAPASVFEEVTPKEHIFHVDDPQSWDKFCNQAFSTPTGGWK